MCVNCTEKPDYCKHHQITVSINRTAVNKDVENWAIYNRHFVPENTTAYGLAKAVYSGFGFVPVYHDNRRKKDHFKEAYHIALDFDTKDIHSSLDTICKHPIFNTFGSFAYSTPSSTKEQPKSRAVFVFDGAIGNPVFYEDLYKALLWQFPHADKSAKDAARLFFGSSLCDLRGNWSIFPINSCADLVAQWRDDLPPPAAPQEVVKFSSGGNYEAYINKCLANAKAKIENEPKGNRHNVIFEVAAGVGNLVGATWNKLTWQDAYNYLSAACGSTIKWHDQTIKDALNRGEKEPQAEPVKKIQLRKTRYGTY